MARAAGPGKYPQTKLEPCKGVVPAVAPEAQTGAATLPLWKSRGRLGNNTVSDEPVFVAGTYFSPGTIVIPSVEK